MPPEYKAPGVYVEETSSLPQPIADVETAIPAFIGYTERARKTADRDLSLVPTKISSMVEYENYFGGPYADRLKIEVASSAPGKFTVKSYAATPDNVPSYLLHFAVRMYFDNGGSECYVISVGSYTTPPKIALGKGSKSGLKAGLDAAAAVDEITLLVVPDAVKLSAKDYSSLVQTQLAQCAARRDRFAVVDVQGGGLPYGSFDLTGARQSFGTENLKYGAAYYPFVKTTIGFPVVEEGKKSNVTVKLNASKAVDMVSTRNSNPALYGFVKSELASKCISMPASGAVAGVYAATDRNRGVWKAPANVSLADVLEPAVKLNDQQQEGFNVDTVSGKSVNLLRAFTGKGTLVWGARTLAGNDNEWRYVNVRRLFILLEESIGKGTQWAVFEPNEASTWVKVRAQVENYLVQKWHNGALQGVKLEQAFYVKCGLGQSMTQQDVDNGRLIVEIGVAAVRPAEFIILRITHQVPSA